MNEDRRPGQGNRSQQDRNRTGSQGSQQDRDRMSAQPPQQARGNQQEQPPTRAGQQNPGLEEEGEGRGSDSNPDRESRGGRNR